MINLLLLLLFDFLLGYLLQNLSVVIFIHGMAKVRIHPKRLALCVALCSVANFLIRQMSVLNFGIHTLLQLLVVNVCCFLICNLDLRKTIFSSIIFTIMILASELFDYCLFTLLVGKERLSEMILTTLGKDYVALPGTVLLFIISLCVYFFRVRRKAVKTNAV